MNINRINNLSADEITSLTRRQELLTAAEEDAFAVRDVFAFRMGEKYREIVSLGFSDVKQGGLWFLHSDCVWELVPRSIYWRRDHFRLTISKESLFEFYSRATADGSEKDGFLIYCYNEFRNFVKYAKMLPKYEVPYIS